MRRETVRSPMSMPSFESSPWIRRAPQRGFAAAIFLTRAAISALRGGRPPGGAGEPGPALAEAAALPAQDGVGRDDDQRLPPAGPDSGQAGPQQAVSRAELRPGQSALVDGELLA